MSLEMLAAITAVIITQELGFYRSSFEWDLEIVMNSLKHGDIVQSFVGHLLKDTLSYTNSL